MRNVDYFLIFLAACPWIMFAAHRFELNLRKQQIEDLEAKVEKGEEVIAAMSKGMVKWMAVTDRAITKVEDRTR